MKAGKAYTPANEIDNRGLVPQGEGGTVVRIPQRQVHQACPISYTNRITRPVSIIFSLRGITALLAGRLATKSLVLF